MVKTIILILNPNLKRNINSVPYVMVVDDVADAEAEVWFTMRLIIILDNMSIVAHVEALVNVVSVKEVAWLRI